MIKSGVYALKAHQSKLIYIGSTSNLRVRKNIHFYHIRIKDKHKGCKAIIESSEQGDSITFEVLEVCDNYLQQEQYWIDFFKNQEVFKVVNTFEAKREGSKYPDSFVTKMSNIRKEKWKDLQYRELMLNKLKATQFSPQRLNKKVLCFNTDGLLLYEFESASKAAETLKLNKVSLSAAARGDFRNSHKYKNFVFYYEVLYKSDKLLEHPEMDNQQPTTNLNG